MMGRSKHDLFDIRVNNLLWDQPAGLQGQFRRRKVVWLIRGVLIEGKIEH